MRIIVASSVLLLLVTPCFAQDETVWVADTKVMACSPRNLSGSGTLRLRLGPGHGKELAIRRESDGAWFFLVVESPPQEMKLLMSPESFRTARLVKIPASIKAAQWDTESHEQRVFSSSGKYYVFSSDNLESEAGGAKCTITYTRHGP